MVQKPENVIRVAAASCLALVLVSCFQQAHGLCLLTGCRSVAGGCQCAQRCHATCPASEGNGGCSHDRHDAPMQNSCHALHAGNDGLAPPSPPRSAPQICCASPASAIVSEGVVAPDMLAAPVHDFSAVCLLPASVPILSTRGQPPGVAASADGSLEVCADLCRFLI